jgi:hypothetical protein
MSQVDIETVHVGFLVEGVLGFPLPITRSPVLHSFIITGWKNRPKRDENTMGHTLTQLSKYINNQQPSNLPTNHNQLTNYLTLSEDT